MTTDFSELGLDYDSVREYLFDLGVIDSVDDTTYTEGELENLMFVTNIILEYSIGLKATEVEELLVDFKIRSARLEGLGEFFANLRYFLTPSTGLADVENLIDFLETETQLIGMEETSQISIDYSNTYDNNEDPVTFDNVQDFLLAVEENTVLSDSESTFLAILYDDYQEEGLFDGIFSTDGTELTDSTSGITQLLSGDAYLKITQSSSEVPEVYLDAEGFQDFVIAQMLQEQEYIASTVYLDPIVFASDSQPTLAGTNAANWIDWHRLYYGKVTIAADADADTLTVDYNGAAGIAELGLNLPELFEQSADSLEVTIYYEEKGLVTQYPADQSFNNEENLSFSLSDAFPEPFEDEDDSWLLWLTGIAAYEDGESLLFASNFSSEVPIGITYAGNDLTEEEYLGSLVLESIGWSTLTEAEEFGLSTSDYLEGDELNSLLEDVATAVEGEAATGEVDLLEVNTALTEWSELHSSWDTVHKYITDASEHAIAAMK